MKEGASREAKDKNYRSQFTRYGDWIEKGANNKQVRQAMVYIRSSEPKFHEIIDERVLKILSKNIAKNNKFETIIQIKNVRFSYDELQLLYKDADKKLRELVKQEQKLQPNLEIRDLIGIVLDKDFDSMEQTFKTLGKTYGH